MANTYGSNTNWANQEKYLNNLVSSGNKGEQSWAKSELQNLYSQADQLAKNTASSAGVTGGVDSSYLFGKSSGSVPIESATTVAAKSKSSKTGTDVINSMYKNTLNAQERQLKASLDDILDQLDAQENETYANQMVANKNSNEAMANLGINSGAIAQAALSSNNALQSNLGTIGEAETEAWKDYNEDLASLQASIEAERLNALLNDYYNQQNYEYQASRDTVSDQQYADSLAYQNKQDKEAWAWNMWQILGYATQEIADTLGIYKGMPYPSNKGV